MHKDYPFVTFQPSSCIHQHRARHPTWVCSSHELYGTRLHSLHLGSHVETCLLRCGMILHNVLPVFISTIQKRIWLTLSSSSLFSFSSSFFVVFLVFIPRADRGVIYMRVLEKIGGFGGFVATGLGGFEHLWRRWVRRLWGEDSTVSWWQPGMCVRIHHVTKNVRCSRRRRIEQGKFSPL